MCMCVGVGGVMVYICTCLCNWVHPCVGAEVKASGLYHFLLFSLETGSLTEAGGHCLGTPRGHLPACPSVRVTGGYPDTPQLLTSETFPTSFLKVGFHVSQTDLKFTMYSQTSDPLGSTSQVLGSGAT